MLRSPCIAAFALATHLIAALVVPVLHRAHHSAHGSDHVHSPTGTRYLSHVHANANDDDFVALELHDVAHAGSANVDCALSSFTLIACDDAPPETFGDALLARTEHSPSPIDLDHERGALEHLAASVLSQPLSLVSPPALAVERYDFSFQARTCTHAHVLTRRIRGPPSSLV